MALDNNAFCWYGIVSTNADAAKKFYSATIGWESKQHTFPNGETTTIFSAAEFPRVPTFVHQRGASPAGGHRIFA